MAPSFSFFPRTESSEGFITAQQVREIRAELRRMSERNFKAGEDSKDGISLRRERVDTEHRGVAGTLVLSDELDEKVYPLYNFTDESTRICRIWRGFKQRSLKV
jgi:hypothetical protein